MKIIKITTNNEISLHDFPKGKNYLEENNYLRTFIGKTCEIYEHVMPKRLYWELGMIPRVTNIPGQAVAMLVDEEGLLKELDINFTASWLYETDKHHYPIVGNILIVGKLQNGGSYDFCGIEEAQLTILYPKLEKIVKKVRDM